MNMPALACPFESASDSQIHPRRLNFQLSVKDAVQLIIEMLARMCVNVLIVMLDLTVVEKGQEPVHANDVRADSQECYKLEALLHLVSVVESIQHLHERGNP